MGNEGLFMLNMTSYNRNTIYRRKLSCPFGLGIRISRCSSERYLPSHASYKVYSQFTLTLYFCKGYFVTKIFHPNVSKTGEICVNTLKKDWKPELGIRDVLLVSLICHSVCKTPHCYTFNRRSSAYSLHPTQSRLWMKRLVVSSLRTMMPTLGTRN